MVENHAAWVQGYAAGQADMRGRIAAASSLATITEQERIIEIIERCPRLDNDRTIDAPTLITLIRGLSA
jgi:hypothetical protein